MNGPQKHASLTTLAFRPVVESLDLTPREAGAIPPVSHGAAAAGVTARTQWVVGISVVLHCIGIVALVDLSRPDVMPPIQEFAFEIVVQKSADEPVPSPSAVAASTDQPPAPVPVAAAPVVTPDPVASLLAEADDTETGGVTVVGKAPEAPRPVAESAPPPRGPLLASAGPASDTPPLIRLDAPTFGLSSALRARAPERTGPVGRLAFASAGHIVLTPIDESDTAETVAAPVVNAAIDAADSAAPSIAEPVDAPAATLVSEPAAAPPTALEPSAQSQSTPRYVSAIRLPGQDADVTGALPPAAPDVSATVLAVASGEAGAMGAPALTRLGDEPPEFVPFPPGPAEEAAAREAAARRAGLARAADAQRARRLADQKSAAEAKARASREAAREAARDVKASAAASRDWRIKVARHIHDFQSYPEAVRLRGFEGTVRLAFTVDGSGKVVSKQVTKSSGDKELDLEALAAVQRASPFPAPPPKASRTFSAPFVYKLK